MTDDEFKVILSRKMKRKVLANMLYDYAAYVLKHKDTVTNDINLANEYIDNMATDPTANRCVCCNAIIPEGKHVCFKCEKKWLEDQDT